MYNYIRGSPHDTLVYIVYRILGDALHTTSFPIRRGGAQQPIFASTSTRLGFRVSVVDADSWTYLVSEGLPRYFVLVSTLCRVPLLSLSYFVVVFIC